VAAAAEKNAASRLAALEQSMGSDAHFFSRHGAQTTIEQQFLRATKGFLPDGGVRAVSDASRFISHRAQMRAVERAYQHYRATGQSRFVLEFAEEVGEGFTRGATDLVRTNTVQAQFSQGKLLTMYPLIR
jgi:hypothetical protein